MDTPPERIDAGAVVLRRWTDDDVPAITRAVGDSHAHLKPWLAWADPPPTEDQERDAVSGANEQWETGQGFAYLIVDPETDAVLGGIGLHRRIGPRAIEVGYWVHVDHAGRGVATTAARAATAAALALDDVDRVEIRCSVANAPSARIPEKLGYRLDRIDETPITAPGETGRTMIWVREA